MASKAGVNVNGPLGAAQRRAAETAMLGRIRGAVSLNSYELIQEAMKQLRNESMTHQNFRSRSKCILKHQPDLRKDLLELTMPGTDVYIFTAPNQPMRFRPYFTLDDLALPWHVQGDNFSNSCAICLCNFTAPIRTLVCKHTYCESCLTQHLAANGVTLEAAGNGRTEVECPCCKQSSWIKASPDALDEKAHNSLLLTLQAETLKYQCPFQGCDQAFLRKDIEKHIDGCISRKYVCDQGCETVLCGYDLHEDAEECIEYLRERTAKAEADARKKDRQVRDLEEQLRETELNLYEAQSELRHGGCFNCTGVHKRPRTAPV